MNSNSFIRILQKDRFFKVRVHSSGFHKTTLKDLLQLLPLKSSCINLANLNIASLLSYTTIFFKQSFTAKILSIDMVKNLSYDISLTICMRSSVARGGVL